MTKKQFRWDIQGMRALAVLAVTIFHINPTRLPGGYLGVDIFFVISGYLIIGFIWRDLQNEKFTLLEFYSKRVKRLFPAFFVTAFVSGIFAYKFLLPAELATFSQSLISSLTYISNFFFYSQSDYFGPDLELAPLLHTWSLSVEEQFYLLFPVMMLFIYKTRKKPIIFILSAIAVLSFILSEIWVQTNAPLAFFATPSRFWQFIAGGLVALAPRPKILPRGVVETLSFTSFAYLIYAFFVYNKSTPFPGVEAFLPTLASTALIFCGLYKNVTSKLLSNPIATFFGQISYSLYLWHWPVIVFFKLGFQLELTKFQQVLLFAISVLLGYLSWRFVENTAIQIKHRKGSPTPIFATLSVSTLCIVICALSLSGVPGRFNDTQLHYASFLNYKAKRKKVLPENECFLHTKRNQFELFNQEKCVNHSPEKNNILLIGDSHADHWARALKQTLDSNTTFSQITSSGCRPYLNSGKNEYCRKLMNWGLEEAIKKQHFQKIIFSGRWVKKDFDPLVQTIQKIQSQVDQVIVLGPIIEYINPLPRLLSFYPTNEIAKFNIYNTQKSKDEKLKELLDQTQAQYVSTLNLVCKNEATCLSLSDTGDPLQYDYGHLTDEAALELLTKLKTQKKLEL